VRESRGAVWIGTPASVPVALRRKSFTWVSGARADRARRRPFVRRPRHRRG
jgi:hypothetical protein